MDDACVLGARPVVREVEMATIPENLVSCRSTATYICLNVPHLARLTLNYNAATQGDDWAATKQLSASAPLET
eukprot:4141130-Pyramimonas_sp.AAC.1